MSLDLAILGDPADSVADLRISNSANDGIYKLVQRVLILLFTDESEPTNLGLGTTLASETISANANIDFVDNAFTLAMDKVKDDLDESYSADYPLDERLSAYLVQSTKTDRGTIEVDLTLTAQSGESTTVKVPIDHISAEQSNNG